MKQTNDWQELLKLAGSQQVRYVQQVEINGKLYPAYRNLYDPKGELIAYTHQ